MSSVSELFYNVSKWSFKRSCAKVSRSLFCFLHRKFKHDGHLTWCQTGFCGGKSQMVKSEYQVHSLNVTEL